MENDVLLSATAHYCGRSVGVIFHLKMSPTILLSRLPLPPFQASIDYIYQCNESGRGKRNCEFFED